MLIIPIHTAGRIVPCGIFCSKKPQGSLCGFFVSKFFIGGDSMILNILFVTITIKKRKYNFEEIERKEMIKKVREEYKDRQFSLYRSF
jgi:uncharacterized protein (TIGR02413 family)